MTRRFSPRLTNVWRYVLVGSLAFSLGGAATVTAAGPIISGFVGLIDGDNTAAISASRELSVTDAGARAHLQSILATTNRLAFDATGNLKTSAQGTQTVTGTVNVGNFPATQAVNGTVGLSPTANTVRVTSANTVLALSELGVALPIPGQPFGPPAGLNRTIDVSSYERIRVIASNHSGGLCFGLEPIVVQIHFGAVGFDSFTLNGCEFAQKVYEVPGTTLRLVAFVPEVQGGIDPAVQGQGVINLQVFGR